MQRYTCISLLCLSTLYFAMVLPQSGGCSAAGGGGGGVVKGRCWGGWGGGGGLGAGFQCLKFEFACQIFALL